jgi:cell division protein FtsL
VHKLTATGLLVLALVALLAALSLVTWRQSRALEALASLDTIQRERSLAQSEVEELTRRIQVLESRTRVVAEARERLGLHVPADDEIVQLLGDAR